MKVKRFRKDTEVLLSDRFLFPLSRAIHTRRPQGPAPRRAVDTRVVRGALSGTTHGTRRARRCVLRGAAAPPGVPPGCRCVLRARVHWWVVRGGAGARAPAPPSAAGTAPLCLSCETEPTARRTGGPAAAHRARQAALSMFIPWWTPSLHRCIGRSGCHPDGFLALLKMMRLSALVKP